MAENDRPLPSPPRSRFGREEQEAAGPVSSLMSDRMALAAAEGRLEEFLQHEIPAGDNARNLAMMMMGMSGMMPLEASGGPAAVPASDAPQTSADVPSAPATAVPPEVLAAIQQGDVANLMGLLRAEHAKRATPDTGESPETQPNNPPTSLPASTAPTATGRAGIDAAIIDELIRISADNDVSVDWLMLRAVKLYVEEYRKTGRL